MILCPSKFDQNSDKQKWYIHNDEYYCESCYKDFLYPQNYRFLKVDFPSTRPRKNKHICAGQRDFLNRSCLVNGMRLSVIDDQTLYRYHLTVANDKLVVRVRRGNCVILLENLCDISSTSKISMTEIHLSDNTEIENDRLSNQTSTYFTLNVKNNMNLSMKINKWSKHNDTELSQYYILQGSYDINISVIVDNSTISTIQNKIDSYNLIMTDTKFVYSDYFEIEANNDIVDNWVN